MIKNVELFDIRDVKLFEIQSYKDKRGFFSEVFKVDLKYSAFQEKYIQENESISNFGVFRGMHFQKDKFSQSKLIRVVKGKVIDVLCDLRKSSPTFKKIIYLNLNPNQILYIPKGLAHGFLSLENGTILNYKCDNFYNQEFESGFNLFKSNLKLKFPLNSNKIIISDKDKKLPDLDNSYFYD